MAEFIEKIRTASGDKQINYEGLANKPADAPSDGKQYARQNGAWAEVTGGGITPEVKAALLNCFAHVGWENTNGLTYYTALQNALNGVTPTTFIITNNLTHCTSSNAAETIGTGESYSATITADEDYTLDIIEVTMGGVDITATAVSDNEISVASVTGNLEITAIATEAGGLPAEYQQVEYISATGTQYIDTGYVPIVNPPTLKVESKFLISPSAPATGDWTIIGARKSGGAAKEVGYTLEVDSGNYNVRAIGASVGYGTCTKGEEHTFNLTTQSGNSIIEIDGTQHTDTAEGVSGTDGRSLFMFALNGEEYPIGTPKWFMNGRIYYCKITDGGTPVRDFVPCYRKSDNVIGMYDLVNGAFYTNDGTGTFGKGANV